jgi:sortase A
MPYATFTYEVTNTRVVKPSDVQIVRDVGRERLVLTASHPLYSAEERYAIFADLTEVELAGAEPAGAGSDQTAGASAS